ncbi:MAG: PQQ-binding-like beta-propeller repeat protein [Bryobacteraceae bacterium]
MSWLFLPAAIAVAALLLPPLALALLWLRPATPVRKKIFYTMPILLLGLVHLVKVYGLRYEMAGEGIPSFFTFRSKAQHQADLEAHRAEQRKVPTETAAVAEASPAAVPSADTVLAAEKPAPPVAAAPAIANYWTDFRGPKRLGIYDEKPILTAWPKSGLTRLWKQPVGGGYSSFVVAGGLAYTIEQRRDQEVTAAYDMKTGREKWTNSWKGFFQESMGGDGPRATPVFDEGRIYALGAEGELRVIDASNGQTVWRKNILQENGAQNLTWGQAATPLIVDGKVIVLPGGGGGKSVVAYDKADGKTIWSSLDDEQAYTAPVVVEVAGKRQLIVVTAQRMAGLTVEDGKLLWEYPWVTEYHVNAAIPLVVAPNRVFISAGYGHGAAVVELTPDGDKFALKEVWKNGKIKTKFNDSVLFEGHVYGLDEGILSCVDVANGQQKWKGGRYGYGQIILAGGHLVITSEQGDVALVKATPAKHEELARFRAIDGKTWNHPAIADGVLLVRNETEMAAFRIGR